VLHTAHIWIWRRDLFVSGGESQRFSLFMAAVHLRWLVVGEIWVCVTRSGFLDPCVSYDVCNLLTLGFRCHRLCDLVAAIVDQRPSWRCSCVCGVFLDLVCFVCGSKGSKGLSMPVWFVAWAWFVNLSVLTVGLYPILEKIVWLSCLLGIF